jgi:mannose-6-phosphate isomerase
MRSIGLLKNTIQNYAWGSTTAIPELLGEKNLSHEPMAELWMGVHPKAPSLVDFEGHWIPLTELISKNPNPDKPEIRNSKYEIRNKFESPKFK